MLPCLTLARAAASLPHSALSELGAEALELDWFEWLGLSDLARARKAAQLAKLNCELILTVPARWLSTQLNRDVRAERMEQLAYWREKLDIKRIHAVLSPATQVSDLPPLEALVACEPSRGSEFEAGRLAPVVDPFHEFGALKESSLPARIPRSFPQGAYLKVHGWHPDRWIRRYSPESIQRLAQWAVLSGATHVCLAHSQRIEQLPELRAALAQATRGRDLKP